MWVDGAMAFSGRLGSIPLELKSECPSIVLSVTVLGRHQIWNYSPSSHLALNLTDAWLLV